MGFCQLDPRHQLWPLQDAGARTVRSIIKIWCPWGVSTGRGRKGTGCNCYRGNVTSAQQRGDDRNVVCAGSWGGKTQDTQLRGTDKNEFLLKHRACCFPKGFFAMGKRNGPNAKINLTLKPEYPLWNRSYTPWGWQREGNQFSQTFSLTLNLCEE